MYIGISAEIFEKYVNISFYCRNFTLILFALVVLAAIVADAGTTNKTKSFLGHLAPFSTISFFFLFFLSYVRTLRGLASRCRGILRKHGAKWSSKIRKCRNFTSFPAPEQQEDVQPETLDRNSKSK